MVPPIQAIRSHQNYLPISKRCRDRWNGLGPQELLSRMRKTMAQGNRVQGHDERVAIVSKW
jgi:hypothetical protein